MAKIGPWSIAALLATLVLLLFAFQGEAILKQPLVIALLAVPILIQVFFNSALAYWLMRSVVIAEDACSSGLGKTIVSLLLAQYRAHAIQSAALLTTTAERYFAGQGFVRVARHGVPPPLLMSTQFQGICPRAAAAMLKVLSPGIVAA